MSVEITNQDRALLQLIAKGESTRGADPYISVYPSTTEPQLVRMTLAEVQEFQRRRINSGFRSSAVGKYQFIRSTLKVCIGYLSVDPFKVCFTPDMQDALIISRLKNKRGYDSWLSSSPDDTDATADFMISLAREFASVPVPYAMNVGNRSLKRGDSYYAGDGLNSAHHDPGAFIQNLIRILTMTGEAVKLVDTSTKSNNAAVPPEGRTTQTQTSTAASGVGVGARIGNDAGSPQRFGKIPEPNINGIYSYRMIDPMDNRYDFRTGEKVNDILTNGTGAKAASPQYAENNSPAGTPVSNAGEVSPMISHDVEYTADDIDSGVSESIFQNWQNSITETINRGPDQNISKEKTQFISPKSITQNNKSESNKDLPSF